jgi:hypothetical protein
MANYLPPTEDLPIFDNAVFQDGDDPLTYNTAINEFLRYPTAQGTEIFNNPTINKKITIQPSSIESRDTANDPYGDPIYTLITPNNISMQNGNGSHITSSISSSLVYLVNEDIGPVDINISAGAVTATNWNIDTTGNPYFSALTSIYVYTQTGGDVEIDLLGLQNLTYSMDMISKIGSLTFINGIINGNYKIYLTGVSGETFYKFSCQNNLLGDTVIGVGSFWILTVHYTGNIYVVDCVNYT